MKINRFLAVFIVLLSVDIIKCQTNVTICNNIMNTPLSIICKTVDIPYFKNDTLLVFSSLDPLKYSFNDNETHSNLEIKILDKSDTGFEFNIYSIFGTKYNC